MKIWGKWKERKKFRGEEREGEEGKREAGTFIFSGLFAFKWKFIKVDKYMWEISA